MDQDAATERTGNPAVDSVLAEVESVGLLPVEEQVAVYERAHERLRRALDAVDADDSGSGGGDSGGGHSGPVRGHPEGA